MTAKQWKQEITRGVIWLIFAVALVLVNRMFLIRDLGAETIKEKASTAQVKEWDQAIISEMKEEDSAIRGEMKEQKDDFEKDIDRVIQHIDKKHEDMKDYIFNNK
jgi:hypothetical protein